MGKITVVGLGPADIDLISLQALQAMQKCDRVILRTRIHPAADKLTDYNIKFSSCDDFYEKHASFDEVYAAVVKRVLSSDDDTVFAVPGDPAVAERTVVMLREACEKTGREIIIQPALGVLNLLFDRIGIDPGDGMIISDARAPELKFHYDTPLPDDHNAFHGAQQPVNSAVPTTWLQVDTPHVASDLKLLLLDFYPPDHPVTVLTALGMQSEEQVTTLPLEDLDRGVAINHLTSLFVPALHWEKRRHSITDLRKIMAMLRGEGGCPWDREQTMQSMKRTIIEEAYEVTEAIDHDDPDAIADELGDVLLNIIFVAQLGDEEGLFNFDDVMQALGDKLIRRHAHVFGDVEANNATAALSSWENIKTGERKDKGVPGIFDDVPLALPALARSQKLQKRAARVGFDWADFRGPLSKLHEELQELSEELGIPENWIKPVILDDVMTKNEKAQEIADAAPKSRIVHELGDILFAAVNLARFVHVDAEEVMREANDRFVRRFKRLETAARKAKKYFHTMTLAEMDELWLTIKGDD
ncbi:MAG: nucleoside triphosphate pyrophosphohydrolase [bacterium]